MEPRPASREGAALALEATYDLASPAFLAGADRNRAEVRLASLKGVLRFWWRALQAQRIQRLETLRAREGMLFGSAEVGQSSVAMRLLAPRELHPGQIDVNHPAEEMFAQPATGRSSPPVHGLLYLGYGVINTTKKLSRACLRTPLELRVRLVWRPFRGDPRADVKPHTLDEARDELCQALQALGLLGGIGARSRRGFGSMVLRKLEIEGGSTWHAPASADALREAIRALYARGGQESMASRLPEWTALSSRAHHLLLVPRRQGGPASGLALLERLGCEMVRFRSFGRNGKILNGEAAERLRFRADHDLYKAAEAGRRPERHPERVVFGLPHNYSKTFRVTPENDLDRRASPLLVHVHQCGNTPVLVLSFLPSRFLPEGSRLQVGRSEGIRLAQGEALWKPIRDFFERLQQPARWQALGIEQVLEVSHDR